MTSHPMTSHPMTSHPISQYSSATVLRTERSHLRYSYLHQITGSDTMVFSIPTKIPRCKAPTTGPQASLGLDDWTNAVRFSAEARGLLLRQSIMEPLRHKSDRTWSWTLFFFCSQLYRASWYYQSLLFTNWCTIELL